MLWKTLIAAVFMYYIGGVVGKAVKQEGEVGMFFGDRPIPKYSHKWRWRCWIGFHDFYILHMCRLKCARCGK